MILRRVEHLEQGGGRIAAPVGADLVHLVEKDDRVHRPGIAQRADEPARQRADVRPPVAADLGLVADAAERHAHELAVERPRDRLADRRLAGAGRPDQGQDRARPLVVRDAAVLAELAHREVLDDAVLDVIEAGVVGVEHLASALRVERLVAPLRPRHGDQPVEVRADHGGLAARVAHRLEAPQLALGLRPDVLGHAGFVDLRAVLVDDRALVLAELLADRVHLLAEEPLALLLLRALLDVVADAGPNLQLGEPLPLELQCELQALDDVDRLEQLDALREADVGRVGAGVGERAGLGDRAQELADAIVGAAQVEDLLHDGAVLALELARLHGRRVLVGTLLHLGAKPAERVGVGRADCGAMEAIERDGTHAAANADAVGDLGDGADGGVLVLVTRHEHDAVLVAHVDGEGDVHAGEDDGVFERDEQQIGQSGLTLQAVVGIGIVPTQLRVPQPREPPRDAGAPPRARPGRRACRRRPPSGRGGTSGGSATAARRTDRARSARSAC